MFGQIVAFFAVAASVAFASCDSCYSGYGVYLNAEPGVAAGIPRGLYQSRILTESPILASPIEVSSRGCSSQIVSAPVEINAAPVVLSKPCSSPVEINAAPVLLSRGCSSQVVSAPVEVNASPVVLSRGCSSQVVSAPVEINAAPLVLSRGCASPVEARESQFLAVGPAGRLVRDVCDACKTYTTPLFRRAVGGSEVYSSCENSFRPAVCGVQTIRQGSICAC